MTTRVVALTGDLMDRSRLSAAVPGLEVAADAGAAVGADVVIVDLARHLEDLTEIRRSTPDAWIVGYGPHVDEDTLATAVGRGADVALPRSRFFRDPAHAILRPPDQ